MLVARILESCVFFGIGELQIVDLSEHGLSEVDAQRNAQLVEHFFNRAEIGHKRGKHERQQCARDLNLELRIAVRKHHERVSRCRRHGCLRVCRIVRGLSVLIRAACKLVHDLLRKLEEVVDLGVVFRSGHDFGKVDIERAVVDVESAEDFLLAVGVFCKVAVFVNSDELDCKFEFVKVAVCDEIAQRTAA